VLSDYPDHPCEPPRWSLTVIVTDEDNLAASKPKPFLERRAGAARCGTDVSKPRVHGALAERCDGLGAVPLVDDDQLERFDGALRQQRTHHACERLRAVTGANDNGNYVHLSGPAPADEWVAHTKWSCKEIITDRGDPRRRT